MSNQNEYQNDYQQHDYRDPYPAQTIDLRTQQNMTTPYQEQAYAYQPSEYQQGYQEGYQRGYYQQPPTINVINNNGYCGPWVSVKNRWVALFLCFFLGYLGFHRFYAGKIGSGLLYLCTGGLFGIGYVVDLIMILVGSFTDGYGYQMK